MYTVTSIDYGEHDGPCNWLSAIMMNREKREVFILHLVWDL